MIRIFVLILFAVACAPTVEAGTTRFCLAGEFDLGARYQGTHPRGGVFYPTTWCVVTDDATERVLFSGSGRSNPDLDGSWTVAYFPPDRVRIVNRDDPPDIEFHDTDNADEARSVRRLDPHRLADEYIEYPQRFSGMTIEMDDEILRRVETTADLPLRGRVPVVWQWDWTDRQAPEAQLLVDGTVMFRAIGSWEVLSDADAQATWAPTPGADPPQVPGENWPSRVAMELVNLTDGVHLVRGVRTGFRHMVVETSEGLVVGDAPAGWVELHQIPPADLVPGLGISGLSERLADFLRSEFKGRKIAAVALTHFHDDHAGGARAFAAEHAKVYAPAASEAFLEAALNRPQMPADRLAALASAIDVVPVAEEKTIGSGENRVRLLALGASPHVDSMLGMWAIDRDYFFVSDVHVPHSDADAPTEARAQTECWFARQAVAHLPGTVRVVNSHSGTVTPVSRLRAYLESDLCQNLRSGGG